MFPQLFDLCDFQRLICAMDIDSFSARNGSIDGSMSPQRVPIITPASGVKPIEVWTDSPPFIAQMLEPLPRWQVIIFKSEIGFPISSA